MENQNEVPIARPKRDRSSQRSEGPAYEQVANKAVYKEADHKTDSAPSVSMTVVGEKVEFVQHFHF